MRVGKLLSQLQSQPLSDSNHTRDNKQEQPAVLVNPQNHELLFQAINFVTLQ